MMASESSCYYRLSLSNSDLENELQENAKSSASNMTLLLDKEINIQDHIYMKSLAAEIAIENLTISNTPNTYSKLDSINLQLRIPSNVSDGNACVTESFINKRNDQICSIQMMDYATSSPQEALDTANQLVSTYTNKYSGTPV